MQNAIAPQLATTAARNPDRIGFGALQGLVCNLAALFHDLGKASVLFNKKLRGDTASKGEPLRHELLSYLIVMDALDQPQFEGGEGDSCWLQVLADNPALIAAGMTGASLLSSEMRAIALDLLKSNGQSGYLSASMVRLNQTSPLLASVVFLVLSHHRLPGDASSASPVNFTQHVNPGLADAAIVEENLSTAAGEKPWENETWLSVVQSTAQGLRDLMQADPAALADMQSWTLATAHITRPSLIVGDYLASINKTEVRPLSEAQNIVLANTEDELNAGDSLTTHLLTTRRYAETLFRLERNVATAFRTASVPETSTVLARGLPAQFAWQEQAADAITNVMDANSSAGFFGVVISETGAGKTIGGVRLMHAASQGELRYTLALSRRSLTMQAGLDYRAAAGFTSRELAVAVGSRLAVKKFEIAAKGTEAFNGADESLLVDYAACGSNSPWYKELGPNPDKLISTRKLLDMVDAPVLVTTADHLVAGVELTQAKASILSLRLMSSDLLLDEIDNYADKDLQTLGKLVFAAGAYGRKVLLMSATMSPALVTGFFESYRRGLALHAARTGCAKPLVTAVVSNAIAPLVQVNASAGAFVQGFNGHVSAFLAAVERRPARRHLGRWDLPSHEGVDQEELFESVLDASIALHGDNKLTDRKTGRSYSVGFVRFNTAKTCFQAAQYWASLENSADEPVIKILTYHAKQVHAALEGIDSTLGRVLKRCPDGDISYHPEVREALDAADRDVLFIVATTTLLETGRDHDYDWAILEPRSVRGEVQAVGRVRRHRLEAWSGTNVLLLSHPLKALLGRESQAWAHPGVARPGSAFQVRSRIHPLLRAAAAELHIDCTSSVRGAAAVVSTARDALPVSDWTKAMSARACLQFPARFDANRIGSLEHIEKYTQLVEDFQLACPPEVYGSLMAEAPALLKYLSFSRGRVPLSWYATHAKLTRFRGSDDSRVRHQLFFNPERGMATVYAFAGETAETGEEVRVGGIEAVAVDASRFWFDMPKLIAREWGVIQGLFRAEARWLHREGLGLSVESGENQSVNLEGRYSPYLGFFME